MCECCYFDILIDLGGCRGIITFRVSMDGRSRIFGESSVVRSGLCLSLCNVSVQRLTFVQREYADGTY